MEQTGIQLHPLQIEAYNNGATAFIMMIVHPCEYYKSRNLQAIRIEPENDPWYKDRNYCIREEGGGWQDFTKKDFLDYVNAPLQVGQKFFIQEEYYEVTCDDECECEPVILYKDWNKAEWNFDTIDRWESAESMDRLESRIKDLTTSTIEVKRVQDICDDNRYGDLLVDLFVNIGTNMANEKERKIRKFRKFQQQCNEIYGQGTYESNPYIFLITHGKDK